MKKLCICLLALCTTVLFAQEARLLRFPTIHEDQIAFSYAGDLYVVSSAGGTARRITSHEGFEMFPRFSPDGSQIAFTGEYDGNTEVYLVGKDGGEPKRLTFTATISRNHVSDRMGPNNIVMTWHPKNNNIVFRSRKSTFNSFIGELYQVNASQELPEKLALPRGGFCSYSPDGTKLAYNQVFREFRTWKRYQGGMADDVWIHDFATKETVNITNNKAQDLFPMWFADRVYFISDRDKVMNLFVYNLSDKTTRKVTNFTEFDIKFPTLGKNALVFENGGYIYRLSLPKEELTKVSISIKEDLSNRRSEWVSVADQVNHATISPAGNRVALGARGEIFTVPAQKGATRNLTKTSGVHERGATFSPNGQWLAYISDLSGEEEIYIRSTTSGEVKQLTTDGDTYKFKLSWSPDSTKIIWGDREMRLQIVDLKGNQKVLMTNDSWEYRDYSWSPDSNWLTFVESKDRKDRIFLYHLATEKRYPVTSGRFGSYRPTFSDDGQYLFYISQRTFNPTYSNTEWNHVYQDMAKVYGVVLSDATNPFAPQSDEVVVVKEETKTEEDTSSQDGENKEIKINTDNLEMRTFALPIAPSNYRNLSAFGGKVYYLRKGLKEAQQTWRMYDLSKKEEIVLGSFDNYQVSANRKKALVTQNKQRAVVDMPVAPLTVKSYLNTSGLEVKLDRRAEWRQIFHECWRQMRDFFYDPGMHGVDWKKMHARYLPLVDHVAHRADLTYVIGEMISELNVGHAYVGGGDLPKVSKKKMGLLGADFTKHESGYFQVAKILRGQNWSELKSPLEAIGNQVQEGEFILAIEGQSTSDLANLFMALENTAGKQISLTVNRKPSLEGSREVTIIPIAEENTLQYYNWVENNLRYVAEKTNGEVGYIHVPDMGVRGLNQFVRYFYPQLSKKALIIDVRGNGGGNVSPMLIERLLRKPAMMGMARNTRNYPNPWGLHYGPKVCLANEYSASDGDIFPYRFKHYGIGKVIGKRTWGGVIGIRGSLPLVDGGYLFKPEFASYGLNGEWVMEGYGVDPDIEVVNDPYREWSGEDQQLDRAIEVALEEMKQVKPLPAIPEFPKRN